MTVAVVIAARNEGDNIAQVVTAAKEHGDVFVVDNVSTDDTITAAVAAGAAVIRHQYDTHIKQSYVDGFRAALRSSYGWIIQMDAGLSHDANDIPYMLVTLEDGADMVIGSRFIKGGRAQQPPHRLLLSRGGSLLVGALSKMPFTDLTSGFKGYRAEVLHRLNLDGVFDNLQARAHAFQFELTMEVWRRGFTITEIPIHYTSTCSSVRWAVVWEALKIAIAIGRSRKHVFLD